MRKVSKDLCRRGLSLFLTLVMCLSMLQLTVLAADDSPDPVGGGNHVHNSEGWICTPYCDIPEHVHTGECYAMVDKEEEEEEVNIPVNLPGDFPVNDGSSTEKDDFGNPYEQPEYIGPDLNGDPGEGEDPGFLVDPEDPDGADVPEGGPGAQPEGPGDEPTTQPEEGGEPSTQPEEGGEPTTQPEEGGEPTTQPEEGGEPSTQPEEGGESVTQPGEDKGTSGEAGENKTEESIGAGEEITDEDPPRSPVPELQCGLEEHHHTKDCTEGEDGGWICEPDTNITINVPENGLVDGRVDLLDGVSATPARCGNWVVQIAVSSVKTADGTELEPEDGQYLEAQEGVIYTVEYAAYVDAAMTADGNSAPVDSIPEGILATQTRTVEGEGVGGAAKMGDAWYDTLQAAIDAVPADQAGTVITLFADVNENIVSNGASYTLDMKGHVLHSGVVGKNVFTVMGGTVTIQNGIITGGDYGDRTNQDGKGLLVNGADVTLENCEIKDNKGCGKKGTTPGYQGGQGGLGGGVYAYNGSLTLIDCTVSENKSSSKGGGIYAENCDVTVTNSKVLDNTTGGGAPSGGGILVSSGSLTIDGATISGNVASNGNGNAIALTGKIENVTIKNSEISSTASGIASVIYANYGTGPINLDLENVDVVNKAAANTTNAIYSGLAGTFTAKDCTFHDSNGRIYFPKATEMSFTNCQFLNNDASYSSAIAPVYLESGNASFTDCTFTGNKGYTAGALYNKSKGAVTINGCLFTQNNATTYTAAGALYVKEETNTTVTDTVVKENQTSGTNSSGPAGGISVNGASGKTTTFTMTSGAVYNNKSEKTNAHDLYVDSRATISILAAKDMTDGDVDFSSYAWSDLTRTVIENELTQGGTWVATPAPEYAASINETKYKTLDEAFEAARKQSRETGENVTVEVAEGYIPLSTYYSVTSGAHPASVTLHLNNTKIYGVGISNSFSVDKDNTLTLSGTGTLNKKIYMMGGTLNIDGNVVVSGGSLSFGQAPIYDKNDKNCKSQININGNVKLVQTALYGGAVTVGKDAHVEKLEASLTNSSGIPLETSFVLNGTVDNLILNPRTARSTAALNGHVGTLTLSQGTNMYDSPRTTPIIKAGENFSADKIEISPALGSAKSYDEETGKDSTGLISIYALQNPTQKFDDQVLIYGGGSYASNTTWTTSMSNKHTDGKDYKFLTTVENVDGNIVLHKTVVGGGNYILLDGVNGDDTQNGDTLSTAVKTFARAKELLNNNIKVIHVLGTVTVSGNETWSLDEGYRLESFPTCKDTLVKVTGSLTLSNVVIDGKDITRTSPLIENRGTLNIEAGTEIKGGVNTVIYGPNNGSGIDGGAVYNSGTLNMTGGSITGNSARTGAGVFSKGTFSLSGGDISNNTGYGGRFAYSYGSSSKVNSAPAGGGVFLAGSSTMNMSGGTIANNTSSVGGGIALGNETNAYISYGGPKLTMTGGTIDKNTAGQGGGIFIQEMCEAEITGGSITGNTATGHFSVATGYAIIYPGGGIYVNGGTKLTGKDGKLYLENPAITGNRANGHGGGIAGCPSADVDINLGDGGIVAGNTGSGGKPYDVYVNRGLVFGTVQENSHYKPDAKFILSKYITGGELYKWHHWDTDEPVLYQDISHTTYQFKRSSSKQEIGVYSAADKSIISTIASSCAVQISGNIAEGSGNGGGIGTNGEVHIGKDPNLNDFFDVIVHKNWLNKDGQPMNKKELAELRKEITSITVQLYRRVVGTEDWKLVDGRLLGPGEEDFWEIERPFTNLLKQLDGQPLEYQVVEEISTTGAWTAADGGVIRLVTPPIREGDEKVTAEGIAASLYFKATITLDWQMAGKALTPEQLSHVTAFKVVLTDKTTGENWTAPSEEDPSENVPPEESGSMEARKISYDSGADPAGDSTAKAPEITIDEKMQSVTLRNLKTDHSYSLTASCEGEYGLNASISPVNDISVGGNGSTGESGDVSHGTLTNQVNAPSLILVKKIDGESLAGQTFKFTIQLEGKEPFTKTLTIPKDGTTDELTLAWGEDLVDAKIGGTFTVTEEKGSWNPNWSVENAMGTPGDAGLTATGTLCYGKNTVTFTNYEPSKVPIPVKKLISGDTPKEIPTFQFELSVDPELKQEGFVMPENTTLTLGSSDFGSGKEASGVFDAIKFSEEGIYKFTVKETSKDADGWTFDSTEWTVTIKALLKDGRLEAKIDRVEAENKTPVSSPEFTNTYEGGKLTIKKVVSGGGSEAQSKEYSFTVTGPNDYSQIVKISGANGWAQTLTGLTPGVYTVKEDDASISGYNWTATGSGVVTANVEAKKTAEVTITNTYDTQTITTTLEVIKVWNDDNSPARPGSILVSLSNSQGIQGYATLSDANNWRHEWTGLDASETWTADEVGVPDGYTSSKTQDGNVVTITNTPTAPPPPGNPPRNPPGTPPRVPELPDPNIPGAPEEVTVVDEDVPLTYVKTWDPEEEEYVYVPEEEVPLADVTPETGDTTASALWTALCLTSAAGLCALHITRPRKKEELN